MSNVTILQHIDIETPGTLFNTLHKHNIGIESIHSYKSVPYGLRDTDGLIIMGGPMSVYETEKYPFLKKEMRLIENALENNIPILGICLGSQLIASVLGSKVYKGAKKELGWHTVHLTDDADSDNIWADNTKAFTAFHWHGDIFDLPRGCTALASSEHTENQAFRYKDNVYGFLFHIEVTETIITNIVDKFGNELKEENISKEEILTNSKIYLPPLNKISEKVFSKWIQLTQTSNF